jgi:hypothetical protein
VAYSSSDLGRLDPIAVVRREAAAFRKLRLRLGILAERKSAKLLCHIDPQRDYITFLYS